MIFGIIKATDKIEKEVVKMGVNRFVLNGVSYHGHGAINEIPGIVKSKGARKHWAKENN